MSSYIDFDYYKKTYKGNIVPQEIFDKFATKASGKVRNIIFNRDISIFENVVKNATCSVVDILYNQYLNQEKLKGIVDGTDKIVMSEKVGDWSRNISNISIDELKQFASDEYTESLINNTLEDYLLSTGLLYCGGF